MKITHKDLVEIGRKWLLNKCVVVITEMSGGIEEPDAIGYNSTGDTILLECKASRSDFLSDKKKSYRQNPENGIGTERYYIAPAGLIKPEELPENWGLIQVNDAGKPMVKVKTTYIHKSNTGGEKRLLISVCRRIGQNAPPGISVKNYVYKIANPRVTVSTAKITSSEDKE